MTNHFRHRTKLILALAALILLIAVGTYYILARHQPAKKVAPVALFSSQPSWRQDFTTAANGSVDPKIWNTATPNLPIYNNEQEVYTNRPQNVRIENGLLVLEAHAEQYAGKSYTSGRIDTNGLQSFLYGKIEATMKFPKGAGTWPAFWLLSSTNVYTKRLFPTDKDWANPRFYMHDGELDVAEQVGSNPDNIESTVHTFDKSDATSKAIPGDPNAFHTYTMSWTPNDLMFAVDGIVYHEYKKTSANPDKWPFDQPMYLILNLAMGGKMGGTIDAKTYQAWQLQVKDIAYFPYISNK